MKQLYKEKSFRSDSLNLIYVMNDIIMDYTRQGFKLTVRQLYYQLVARDYIPNTEQSYKRITGLVNDARIAGVMDWDAIEDRTRDFIRRSHWSSPGEIVSACASSYHEDMWENQDSKVFVIVEKEALVGVLEGVCHTYDVPLLAARGYPSGTVLREFAHSDLMPALNDDKDCLILHLGDHDPSGMDMSRDLDERLAMFSESYLFSASFKLKRIALNMAQIQEVNPPENPAKSTDARFNEYRRKFGSSSWELDALSPQYLANLIRKEIDNIIDPDKWEESKERIEDGKASLRDAEAWLEQKE